MPNNTPDSSQLTEEEIKISLLERTIVFMQERIDDLESSISIIDSENEFLRKMLETADKQEKTNDLRKRVIHKLRDLKYRLDPGKFVTKNKLLILENKEPELANEKLKIENEKLQLENELLKIKVKNYIDYQKENEILNKIVEDNIVAFNPNDPDQQFQTLISNFFSSKDKNDEIELEKFITLFNKKYFQVEKKVTVQAKVDEANLTIEKAKAEVVALQIVSFDAANANFENIVKISVNRREDMRKAEQRVDILKALEKLNSDVMHEKNFKNILFNVVSKVEHNFNHQQILDLIPDSNRFGYELELEKNLLEILNNEMKIPKNICTNSYIVRSEFTDAYQNFLAVIKNQFFKALDKTAEIVSKNTTRRNQIFEEATPKTKDIYKENLENWLQLSAEARIEKQQTAKIAEELADKEHQAAVKNLSEIDEKVAVLKAFILRNLFFCVLQNPKIAVETDEYLNNKSQYLLPTFTDKEACSITSLTLGKFEENDEKSLNLNVATLKILLKNSIDSLNLGSYSPHNIDINKDKVNIHFDFEISKNKDTNRTITISIKNSSQIGQLDFSELERKSIESICSSIEYILKDNKVDVKSIKTANGKSYTYNFNNVSEQLYKQIKFSISELKNQEKFSIPISVNKINQNGKLNIFDLSEFKDESTNTLFNLVAETVNQQLKNAIPSPIKNLFLLDLSPPLVLEITLDATVNANISKNLKVSSMKDFKRSTWNISTKIGEISFISGSNKSFSLGRKPLSAGSIQKNYNEFIINKYKNPLSSSSQANLVGTYYFIQQTIQNHLGIKSIESNLALPGKINNNEKKFGSLRRTLSYKKSVLKEPLKQVTQNSFEALPDKKISDILRDNLRLTDLLGSSGVLEYDGQAIGASDKGQKAWIVKSSQAKDEKVMNLFKENTEDPILSKIGEFLKDKKTLNVNELSDFFKSLQQLKLLMQPEKNGQMTNRYNFYGNPNQNKVGLENSKETDENNNNDISPAVKSPQ